MSAEVTDADRVKARRAAGYASRQLRDRIAIEIAAERERVIAAFTDLSHLYEARGEGTMDGPGGFLCPTCFIRRAEQVRP